MKFYLFICKLLFLLQLDNSNSLKYINRKKCFKKEGKNCAIICKNMNLIHESNLQNLNEVFEGATKFHSNCSLIFKECSYLKTGTFIWKMDPDKKAKITEIKIVNSLLSLNNFDLTNFTNLHKLTVANTNTKILKRKTFRNISKLKRLQIKKNIYLNSVERSLLLEIPHLEYLQIKDLKLDKTKTKIFFGNLTSGGIMHNLRTLDWSDNNIGVIRKDTFENYPNLEVILVENSNIYKFENGAFDNLTVKKLYVNRNKIKYLPERDFGWVPKNNAFLYLSGNDLVCDCDMLWLQEYAKEHRSFGDYKKVKCNQNTPFLHTIMCDKKINIAYNQCPFLYMSWLVNDNFTTKTIGSYKNFTISNDNPDYLEIYTNDVNNTYLWYVNFVNVSYNCIKFSESKLYINTTPDMNYIFCLITWKNNVLIQIDCQPIKTKPLYENQTWLTYKSIPILIISIMFIILFALFTGGLILYLSVHKNPSLIKGSKRVIEVKRHDKAQLLLMPSGYENINETGCRTLSHGPLVPCRPSLSYDTLSTVSYISAIQPTAYEIFTYRLNRLRETFQNNNSLSRAVPEVPQEPQQRIPPHVDLLFEYEWHTITTTTTTTNQT